MIDSISSVASLAIAMQQQKTAQDVEMAVMSKVQDLQQQQGEAVLQLLDSAAVPATTIDIRV